MSSSGSVSHHTWNSRVVLECYWPSRILWLEPTTAVLLQQQQQHLALSVLPSLLPLTCRHTEPLAWMRKQVSRTTAHAIQSAALSVYSPRHLLFTITASCLLDRFLKGEICAGDHKALFGRQCAAMQRGGGFCRGRQAGWEERRLGEWGRVLGGA